MEANGGSKKHAAVWSGGGSGGGDGLSSDTDLDGSELGGRIAVRRVQRCALSLRRASGNFLCRGRAGGRGGRATRRRRPRRARNYCTPDRGRRNDDDCGGGRRRRRQRRRAAAAAAANKWFARNSVRARSPTAHRIRPPPPLDPPTPVALPLRFPGKSSRVIVYNNIYTYMRTYARRRRRVLHVQRVSNRRSYYLKRGGGGEVGCIYDLKGNTTTTGRKKNPKQTVCHPGYDVFHARIPFRIRRFLERPHFLPLTSIIII